MGCQHGLSRIIIVHDLLRPEGAIAAFRFGASRTRVATFAPNPPGAAIFRIAPDLRRVRPDGRLASTASRKRTCVCAENHTLQIARHDHGCRCKQLRATLRRQ
jgi:hypothetical protein